MAIIGTHALLYTSEPERVREILRDLFEWQHVDAGDGWLIFRMPPAEVGVHPAETGTTELTLMCDDLAATIDELRGKGLEISGEPNDQGWGITTTLVLPGGLNMMLYEPRHPTAV